VDWGKGTARDEGGTASSQAHERTFGRLLSTKHQKAFNMKLRRKLVKRELRFKGVRELGIHGKRGEPGLGRSLKVFQRKGLIAPGGIGDATTGGGNYPINSSTDGKKWLGARPKFRGTKLVSEPTN